MPAIEAVIQALWFIASAYAANSLPVLLHGRRPIDCEKTFRGKRIFGDGKTWEGTIGGIIFGIFIGMIQVFYQHLIPSEWNLNLITMTVPIIVLLSIGTMAGDIAGSFIKRRMNIERGGRAFPLDQLGFLVAALLFVVPVFIPDIVTVVILLVLTPLIHLISNMFGYLIRIKNKPW